MTGHLSPTPRQMDALRFIRGFMESTGLGPRIRDIAAGIGTTSVGTTHQLLVDCERAGLIRRLKERDRAIELLVDIPIPRAPDGAPLFAVRVGVPHTQRHGRKQ